MDEQELRARIAAFPRWHYRFDLAGVKTPIVKEANVNRHEQRSAYFFDALLSLTGGTLKGKRVLDLGCNAGFWSLRAIEAGCDFVYGIDGRQMHIDQASLVFEVKGVDPSRYAFAVGDVFSHDLSAHGPFEVVLCLGLLYHVGKPVELFERMSAVGTDLLVIDTVVSNVSGGSFQIRHEKLDDPRNAVDHEIVLIPTRRAVLDLARQFGYRAIPLALQVSRSEGMDEYLAGERLAFLCAKATSLDGLRAGLAEPPLARPERALRRAIRLARMRILRRASRRMGQQSKPGAGHG